MVLGILSLTLTLSAAAQVNNQAVPSAPFVVQPASFFQPFQATAPFYINSPYHPPAFVPNPPYNPTPNYWEAQPPVVIPAIDVPAARPLEPVPVEQLNVLPESPAQESPVQVSVEPPQGAGEETGVIREKPSPVTPGPVPAAPSAVLALRSGTLIETQNYVIAGDTVLISSGRDSRRIKVSDLDVARTQTLNQQRGIHFAMPR
jgi:hypothetical protein